MELEPRLGAAAVAVVPVDLTAPERLAERLDQAAMTVVQAVAARPAALLVLPRQAAAALLAAITGTERAVVRLAERALVATVLTAVVAVAADVTETSEVMAVLEARMPSGLKRPIAQPLAQAAVVEAAVVVTPQMEATVVRAVDTVLAVELVADRTERLGRLAPARRASSSFATFQQPRHPSALF